MIGSGRYNLFWRLRDSADVAEIRRTERWLAVARVFLAISALIAVFMDAAGSGHSPVAFGLLSFYLLNSTGIMLLLRRRQQSSASFRFVVHAADILWPAVMAAVAADPWSPFFLFFVFVLAAAAYRWGVWETLGTAGAEIVLLWGEGILLRYLSGAWTTVTGRRLLAQLHLALPEFEPHRLFMVSVYLLVMAMLLGYLAEQQKRLRVERATVARVLQKASVEAGLTVTMQDIFAEIATLYEARRALIVSQESHSHRVFRGEIRRTDGSPSQLKWLPPSGHDQQVYLFDSSVEVFYAQYARGDWSVLGLDAEGLPMPVPDETMQSLLQLAQAESFQSVAMVQFSLAEDWRGRIFMFDAVLQAGRQEKLRFLQDLVFQVGPAVYNVYLLHRLRRRAGAAERARFARELHDGAVQSLIGVELQVDVLRRQAAPSDPAVSSELGRIQSLLREEVLKLRELMQEMKSMDVDSKRLLRVIADTVDRFQRETGIQARFVVDAGEIDLPQRVCRELARIVQEGLVNVRKHSGARQVLVRLARRENHWLLTLEDDGKGFAFSGSYSQAQLDELGKAPMIIQERVRLIEGQLAIESSPVSGARLEVTVPVS